MSKQSTSPYLSVFTNRRVAAVSILGFSSGLPLAMTGSSLQAWMTVAGVDLTSIGLFGLVALPYTVKFLWAPLMDRFAPLPLGRRRGWIAFTQLALAALMVLMSFAAPDETPFALAALALSLAFMSASQDIVIDAYRTDILRERERGAGVAVFVTMYRLAMITSGAMALIAADRFGWPATFRMMAVIMAVQVAGTLLAPEPDGEIKPPRTLSEAVWGPLKNYFSKDAAILTLALIVLYKLGDAYAGSLSTTFLLRGMEFTQTEVGAINKGFGLAATIAGSFLGGILMARMPLYRALMAFGILQAVSNLSYMALAVYGKNFGLLIFAIGFENFTGGMGSAAFVALLMALCDHRFSATQYAILSSLSALGRTFVTPTSGYLVEYMGWAAFFGFTAITALPGLALLWFLRGKIDGLNGNQEKEAAV
ncbi:MAG: MFS transporter [Nitrospinae bacterium]|nr:MFS transporter [Nitrospinota bacterium]